MPVEPTVTPDPVKKKKSVPKAELRVVFDTNALYVTSSGTGSASDLVRQEISTLISESKYPDLQILWYLPAIVRHERQYQMRAEASKLRPAINKIERLLGHNLALTDQVLQDHVQRKIDEKKAELGLHEIALEHNLVDWNGLIHAAAYRLPPFQAGDKEKGFRDALVAESFIQLLSQSPKTPKVCRVVLVTADELLKQAVDERIAGYKNASVVSNIEELEGLIKTIISDAGPEFIAQLKDKATKVFFTDGSNNDALFYTAKIQQKLREKFHDTLNKLPEGTSWRENGAWRINQPNFSRKEGRRIFWTSRIEVELEAGTIAPTQEYKINSSSVPFIPGQMFELHAPTNVQYSVPLSSLIAADTSKLNYEWVTKAWPSTETVMPHQRKICVKGKDIFEILWSTELTMAKELKKATIIDIRHIELTCQTIS
jgi:hypothetical protein